MELASRVQEVVLRGRSTELAAVTGLIAGARAGHGGFLVVAGAPGMGKTALLRSAEASAAGFTVLRAAGHPDETTIAYGGLQRLLAPIPVAGTGPVLAAVHGHRPDCGRLALALAVLHVLRAAARDTPVLCLLDDLDLLDDASRDVLTAAGRRLETDPVAMLATSRRPVAPPVRTLSRLDAEASRELLADRRPGLPDDTAAALIELAGGNPAALTDLAGAMADDPDPAGAPPPDTLPPASALARTYRAQLAALPGPARWLLLLIAADPELDAAELLSAAAAGGTAPAFLDPAEAAGLVVLDGPAVRFAEPVLRAVTYHGASPARRRAAHHLLADVLGARGHRLRALTHRAAATPGPDDDLAGALVGAATGGPPRAASAALEHAARLTADPGPAAAIRVAAARHAWLSGDRHRAGLLLRRVAQGRADSDVRIPANRLAGEMQLRGALPGSAAESLLGVAAESMADDPTSALDALLLAGEAVHLAGEHGRYQEIARRALALPGDPESLAFCYVAGLAAMFRGDHAVGFARLRAVVRLAEAAPDAVTALRGATAALLVGDDSRADDLAQRSVLLARQRGEAAPVPRALEIVAFAGLATGRHDAATAAALDGAASARRTGQPRLAEIHLGILAVLAAMVGDRDTCVLRVRAAGVQDCAEGPGQARALCEWALAVLDLVEDRPRSSVLRLQTLVTGPSGHGNLVIQVAATPHLVEAAWRDGEPAPLADVCAAFDAWAGATGKPAWLALRERCRALRAADGHDAERHFREALRQHRAGDSDFARAHTELLFGRELRRRRRPSAAREHLRNAGETFRLLGVERWATYADLELRAAGEHVSRRVKATVAALTPQQERIARLVAAGATNREVAEHLFLSPRTVDHHLRNVFVTLGVRSRTELAGLMIKLA
jgi:DNA-binding CsgD family transcriptional regulator